MSDYLGGSECHNATLEGARGRLGASMEEKEMWRWSRERFENAALKSGVMQAQAKERWKLERRGTDSLLDPSEAAQPCGHLGFNPLIPTFDFEFPEQSPV